MKYRYLVILLLFVLVFMLPALAHADPGSTDVLYPILEDSLWGYMNQAGEVVIKPQFAEAEPFRGNYSVVRPITLSDYQSSWRGIIDRSGQWVFPPDGSVITSLDDSFLYIGGRDEGIYIIENPDLKAAGFLDIPSGFFLGMIYQWVYADMDKDLVCVMVNNHKGFSSRTTGGIVIPCLYDLDFSYSFVNGYCNVLPSEPEIADGWILIDRHGAEIPLPQNCYATAAGDVGNGLAPVWNSSTQLCGYMDLQGNVVIEPQYIVAYPFSEGLACVRISREGNLFSVITPDNEIVTMLKDDLNRKGSSFIYSHGLLRTAHYDENNQLAYIAFLDHNGIESFRIDAENLLDVTDFDENGLAFYITGEETRFGQYFNMRYGLFNIQGEKLTQPVFCFSETGSFDQFSEGLIPVIDEKTGKSGYINERGEWAIPATWDKAMSFYHGLAAVEEDEYLSYINHEGVVVWQENKENAS